MSHSFLSVGSKSQLRFSVAHKFLEVRSKSCVYTVSKDKRQVMLTHEMTQFDLISENLPILKHHL